MARPRRLAARITKAATSADSLTAAGIACLAAGAGLAWLPLGLVVLGLSLIAIARYGAEES